MDLELMRARREEVGRELQAIHEKAGDRALVGEEAERWDAGMAELRQLRDQIQKIEQRQDQVRNLAAGGYIEAGTEFGSDSARSSAGGSLLARAQRTIDAAHKSGQLPDHGAERAMDLVTNVGTVQEKSLAARWVAVAGAPEYRSAFAKLLADPNKGHLLWTGPEADAYRSVAALQAEMRAMSIGTPGNGGYMVPMTLDPALNLTSGGSINPLRRISRVVQTVTNSWTGLNSAGATAEWKAEAAEVADATPPIDDVVIPVHFGDAFVPYSFEVGMDAVNFLQELQDILVDAADQLQATAYTTGSGTGQPKGIVTALTGTSSVVNSGTADVLKASDFYAVQAALPPRFQDRAQWVAALPIINAARQFETPNGAKEFPELADGRLLNRPLSELSNMDGVINATQENYVSIYGDFSKFVIVDRIGTTLELIPNLMGANRRPTGQRGALMWFRTGSDVLVPNAFRMLNVT